MPLPLISPVCLLVVMTLRGVWALMSYQRVPAGFLALVVVTWFLDWGISVLEAFSELPLPLFNPTCLPAMMTLLKPLLATYVLLILMHFAYPAEYVRFLAVLLLCARTGSSWSPPSRTGPWGTS